MNKVLKLSDWLGRIISAAAFILILSLPLPIVTAFLAPAAVFAESDSNTDVKLNVDSKSLVSGSSYALKVYNTSAGQKIGFSSGDEDIATVDSDGVITGVSNGRTVITAIVSTGDSTDAVLNCTVTVGPAAISVKWTKTEALIIVGRRMTLKTMVLPYNCVEDVTFYSANRKIAAISASGRITAKKVGVTYVYAIIANGKYDCCKVTVVDEDTYEQMILDAENASENDNATTVTPTPVPTSFEPPKADSALMDVKTLQ